MVIYNEIWSYILQMLQFDNIYVRYLQFITYRKKRDEKKHH